MRGDVTTITLQRGESMEGSRAVNVEVPTSLYERVKDQAENECTSMASVVRRALDEYCGKFEVPPGPKLGRRPRQLTAAE